MEKFQDIEKDMRVVKEELAAVPEQMGATKEATQGQCEAGIKQLVAAALSEQTRGT